MEGKDNTDLIILVGPKHVGKTTTGKALAERVGRDFIDLDDRITVLTGKSPRELYTEGAAVFRRAEAEAARSLVSGDSASLIVAAGGGLIDNPEALSILREHGILVALELDTDTAWSRVESAAARTGSLPPFLQGDNPREIHRELHERRALAWQEEADICVETGEATPDELAHLIASLLLDPIRR